MLNKDTCLESMKSSCQSIEKRQSHRIMAKTLGQALLKGDSQMTNTWIRSSQEKWKAVRGT